MPQAESQDWAQRYNGMQLNCTHFTGAYQHIAAVPSSQICKAASMLCIQTCRRPGLKSSIATAMACQFLSKPHKCFPSITGWFACKKTVSETRGHGGRTCMVFMSGTCCAQTLHLYLACPALPPSLSSFPALPPPLLVVAAATFDLISAAVCLAGFALPIGPQHSAACVPSDCCTAARVHSQ
jgi:hypothetical protein